MKITREMLDAGRAVLSAYAQGWDDPDECVQKIYSEMFAARHAVNLSNAPPAPGPKRRGQRRSTTTMKKHKGKTPPGKPGKKGY